MSEADSTMAGFLSAPEVTADAQRLFDTDLRELGFVMNATRLWAYQPSTITGVFDLLAATKRSGRLSYRQVAILVATTASTLGDSYCSLAWGMKLAEAADGETAASVLRGDDKLLSPAETALALWARRVVQNPNDTTPSDVLELRNAGFDDAQIFAMTVLVALRLAFSTINDALGANPDYELRPLVPDPVLDAITFGRPIDEPSSWSSSANQGRHSGRRRRA